MEPGYFQARDDIFRIYLKNTWQVRYIKRETQRKQQNTCRISKKWSWKKKLEKQKLQKTLQKYRKSQKKNPTATEKKVEHPKYGMGVVVSENEDIVRVQFEDYGEKELLKAFSQLKYM